MITPALLGPLRLSLVALCCLAAAGQEADQPHSIKSNLEYRLAHGDLPQLSFGVEKPKAVEVTGGGEELLEDCLNDTADWAKDPLLFRLAHTHAVAIQSCREKRSPSLHAVFRRMPDGTLECWVHFDGHGSQTSGSRMAHLGEFLFHKVTFRNNDQDRMFENLDRSFSSSADAAGIANDELSNRERFDLFSAKTLTRVQPYASSIVSSAVDQLFSPARIWGTGADRFTNHLLASFTQRLVTYGIQSGVAAAMHEDLRYRPSHSRNVWKRVEHALASTFVIETPRGYDVAFANIVAAVGSGVIINTSHPGREHFDHPGAWKFAGMNVIGFAQSNLWSEFKPDLKHLVRRKILHRHEIPPIP